MGEVILVWGDKVSMVEGSTSSLFFSLVAIWPLTAQVWSPVKNFSCLIKLTLSVLAPAVPI